jgi:lipid A 3-O-deacylase
MRHTIFATTLAFAAAISAPALACEPCAQKSEYLQGGIGYYDVINGNDSTVSGSMEYQGSSVYHGLRPVAGLLATGDGGVYGYAGGRWDLPLGTYPIIIAPSFTAGAYRQGEGKDLGHALEFRSGIEVDYQLENNHRVGVSFSHISNASIGNKNPGVEILQLTYAVPVSVF